MHKVYALINSNSTNWYNSLV